MNLLADESVDRPIVEYLRQKGHSVWYIAEISPSVSDDVVLKNANTNQAVLLTCDKDFGELVYRQGRIHLGVILVRLLGLSAESKAKIVADAIRTHAIKLQDAFSVITPSSIRIRHRF